jgi:putative FmdB family regulatory protein
MPLYDYDCAACGRRIEVVHGVHAPAPTHCPNCGGGPLKKAFSTPTIHFKGSGWAKKERRAATKSSTSSDGGSSGDASTEPAKAGAAGEAGNDKSRDTSGDKSGEKRGDKSGDKSGDTGPRKAGSATASASD